MMTTGGISLIILLMVLGIWQTGNRLVKGIEGILLSPPSPPEVDVSTLIIHQIRGVSELTTTVFVTEAVIPASQDWKIGELTLAKTKLLYIAHGEVRAGVDLSQLSAQNILVEGKTIKLQLPPPQILDSKIDVNQSQVYDYDRGFLNLGPDVAPQLQTLAQQKALEKLVNAACRQNILTEANNRAEITLNQLLTTAGYHRIEITTTLPEKCQ